MDIGAFAIDDYLGNGGGTTNLNYMIASGQNFYWAASYNVPGYSSATAPAGAGTNGPTFAVDLRNDQVTKAAITNSINGSKSREYCDFVYYGGHGMSGSIYLGASTPTYGQVFPDQFNFGLGYNRWLMTNSCNLFNVAEPASTWRTAFQGLKAMLGFKSVVFDNNLSWDLYHHFWYYWTYGEKSLVMAFFEANTNYGYKHLYPTKGLEPGCLSAQVLGNGIDHCLEAFKYASHDYAPAMKNTGYYYSKKIGQPQY